MKPTYRQLQSTLAVGSRVLINGGCAPRLYNKRGYVIDLRNSFAIIKLDVTAEAVSVVLPDLEVTESEHSKAILAARESKIPQPTESELKADDASFSKFLNEFSQKHKPARA